jgi:lysozyme
MLNAVIDLSHHNTIQSFTALPRVGIYGVIHKATQGTTFVDSEYAERQAQALDAGLLWGAYHFGEGGRAVADQVAHFLDTTQPGPTDLLVLDWEPCSQAPPMTLAEAEEFVTLVGAATGRIPGLYMGMSFCEEQCAGCTSSPLQDCFLWLARYSDTPPVVPPLWSVWTFWQYTDGCAGPQPHRAPGIGRCDRDKFNGDAGGLHRLWGLGPELLV